MDIWLGLKTRFLSPPPNFCAIVYWWKAFLCNRSRLRELTLLLGTCHCQLPVPLYWGWELHWGFNKCISTGDHFEMHKSDFYPWTFPSLLALVGVTIENVLHWLPKATIATRLQRGVAPWSRSSDPARGRSVSDCFP